MVSISRSGISSVSAARAPAPVAAGLSSRPAVLYHQATKLASKQDIARREQDVAAAKIKLNIVDE